jgi:sulfur dioxygenase
MTSPNRDREESAMGIAVEELNATNCKTYLLQHGDQAALVDPVRERVETYASLLEARDLTLRMILETHTHADHLMFSRDIKERFEVPVIMHRLSPSPLVDRHVEDGDTLELGGEPITVLHTPGHTPDSVCFLLAGAVLTGDTLLIGGSGRTDFPGGDAGEQYDSIVGKLFTLPDEIVVHPGHDYRGQVRSTIGREKRENPRLAGRDRQAYVTLMQGLNLPVPERIQEALQVNQSGFEPDEVAFPSVHDLRKTLALRAMELATELGSDTPPLVLDVREPEEFVGDLGHIRGSLLVPLDSLARRLPKLMGYADRTVVVACRAGARSATAVAILKRAGFAKVRNLEGGMLAWTEAGFRTEH